MRDRVRSSSRKHSEGDDHQHSGRRQNDRRLAGGRTPRKRTTGVAIPVRSLDSLERPPPQPCYELALPGLSKGRPDHRDGFGQGFPASCGQGKNDSARREITRLCTANPSVPAQRLDTVLHRSPETAKAASGFRRSKKEDRPPRHSPRRCAKRIDTGPGATIFSRPVSR